MDVTLYLGHPLVKSEKPLDHISDCFYVFKPFFLLKSS